MIDTPAFLDAHRPDVPDLVIPQGVTPFYLAGRPVRGRLVRLGALADALLSRHDNPDIVLRLAGEALALVGGLASALKFQGSFSLQAKGDGPVSLLVADCTHAGALRFHAHSDDDAVAALAATDPDADAARLLGGGYLAFTVDQGPDTDLHQGIVAMTGTSLSEMATHYFETSEQHACWVRLACTHTDAGWRAAALILERIATEGGIAAITPPEGDEDDMWSTAMTLAATVTDAELLDDDLSSEALLYRLFHAEDVCADRPRALAFGCRCSRARLSGILETFGREDLDHMAEDGTISMHCAFCNISFRFGRDEVGGPVTD
ncbi:33 kDa chaperonin [Gluconacetobacter liquefaciens]|uniref:Hsp33 family molecular chaperone HslO n=1 Tax=Gluconacetobacter liquefaciens TaxID=89584 RepID=A0A370GF57_GLULI|nr:Hsp33 family molecular chaperone HslO [Gluconacetobacter liquefaciens]MBB2185191.1 Hsp33 family molecular chaperone HslO [Gluconacetobacter liquefaciens]RDI40623.1 molecular chaperone Hsp33 [Gluconacetobacter liquefaciens]GBR10027.1 heat shock protein Hsp33 [Gluconacetobacter liquefaciens NRIC 0522]GEB36893.1 33 kDa chaperonin [Gluconacetobacter liquefaciens]